MRYYYLITEFCNYRVAESCFKAVLNYITDVRDIDGYHLLTFAERRSQEIKDILDIDAWKKEIDIYANPKFDKLYKLQMTMELKKLKTKYR